MWGLGCILLEMFYRKPFFMGTSEINQLEIIAELCGSPNETTLPGWSSLPGVRNSDSQGRIDESDRDGFKGYAERKRCLTEFLSKGGVTM